MAIGPRIFMDKYKDLSIDELNDKLRNLKIYLKSDELKKARKEEIRLGIDDNNCVTNVESEIKAIEILIKEKSENGLKGGNVQIKDIIVEYQKNGITDKLVELLNCFSNEIIKDNKQDPFWTDSAKNIFKLLLLSNLLDGKEITIQLLIEQTRTADKTKIVINSKMNRFDMPELRSYMSSTSIINSDKPFKSIVDIIYNSLNETLKEADVSLHTKDLIKSKKSGTENEINKEISRCPNCNERLLKSMPGGDVFFCNKCGKCFENDNGNVGKETTSPYTKNDVLY